MNIAAYARTSAAEGDQTVEQILASLSAYAARRGWEVALECSDQGPSLTSRREGLRHLTAAVSANAVQGVLVQTLGQLARSLRHLTDLGQLLARHEVALVAIEDHIDTTDPGGMIRWRDWLEISLRLDRHIRAEGARLARMRASDEPWGRPAAAVNPLELVAWWEGRKGRRPLSQREIAGKLGISEATVRKHLRELRDAGQVDDEARSLALAARGGLRRGGRPANTIDDDVLVATWEACRRTAHRRGKEPSIATLARHLRVSRSRVRSRLQELGLLSADHLPGAPKQASSCLLEVSKTVEKCYDFSR